MNEHTIYDLVGGDATFQRIVDVFYERVLADPLLRDMFPDDIAPGKLHQFLFLTQFFGASPRYAELRGHPRLRMRHAPFAIGPAERDAWLGHMLAAVDAADVQEPMRSGMREYFARAATHMINRDTSEITPPK